MSENITPEAKLSVIQPDVDNIAQQIEALVINSEESCQEMSMLRTGAKTRIKRIDELRTFFVKPLNEQVDRINGMFMPQIKKLKAIDEVAENKMKVWIRAKEEAKRKEIERIAAEKAAAEAKTAAEAKAAQEAAEAAQRAAQEAQAAAANAGAEAQAAAQEAEQAANLLAKQAEIAAQEAELAAKVEADRGLKNILTPSGVETDIGKTIVKHVWTHKIVDINLIPREYFVLDEKLIREAVRNGERNIAGVEIFQDIDLAQRSK